MKALRILTFTLLLSVFIVGIQSQAPKPPRYVFQLQLNSVLSDMRDKLSDQEDELDEIKGSVGRSSTKAAKLLNQCVKIIYYLEELLGVSADAAITCPVPGTVLSPTRGLCYLLVTDPTLVWSDANEYCHALGGYLIQPLPLDVTLGTDLQNMFPALPASNIWVDGVVVGTLYVYQNGFVSPIPNANGNHLIMELPPAPTPIISEAVDADERPFICQFNATTVFPPYKRSYGYDEYETNIPHRKYMVDVESVNEVYHHSGENGYGHPYGGYSGEMYPGEGGNSGERYPMEGGNSGEMYPGEGGNPGGMYPGGGNPGDEYPSGNSRKQNTKVIS